MAVSNPAATGRFGIITGTRALNAAAGDVAYTGLGFQPNLVICISANQAASFSFGAGISDGTNELTGWILNGAEAAALAGIAAGGNSNDYGQTAVVKSFDADGLTLTWTQLSSPSSTVTDLLFLCFRI